MEKKKRKLKLKKHYLHPVTTYILLTFLVLLLSGLLSLLGLQSSYNRINPITKGLESVMVTTTNLLGISGLKYIIGNALKNFVSFTTLSNLLVSLIGVSIAESSGLFDAFIKKYLSKLSNFQITLGLIFLATISSIVNDVGYTILIPLGAIVFYENDRNPLAGIIAAYGGVAFGYGVTLFAGSLEMNLISITESAALLVDTGSHIALLSNLFIIITTSIVLSIVGALIVENLIVPRMGKYREAVELTPTDINTVIDEEREQEELEKELLQNKGLKHALIAMIIIILIFAYGIVPGLPFSGYLLDESFNAYSYKLFGENSYFQDGFTFLVSLFFIVTGIAYGVGSKTFKNDKDIFSKTSMTFEDTGELIITIFAASQFISIFRESNIGYLIAGYASEIISNTTFTGIPLILLVLLLMGVTGLFISTPVAKWTVFAPVVVPKLMQSNISPQFAQFIFRASDSLFKGLSPLLAFFVIYIGYLNIYNPREDRPITIKEGISYVLPYFGVMAVTWILIIVGAYIIGLPIGPNVYPTV